MKITVRIMAIIKQLEIYKGITNIMKNHENHENHRNPYEYHENHKIH